jgi:UDP-glucose 4-epimerase
LKALVTGGAGFIGSSLCEALLGEGYQVVAYDDLSTGSLPNVSALKGRAGFEFVKGDCREMGEVRPVVRGSDAIFHLAASAEVRLNRTSPQEMFEENVTATQVLLEAARSSNATSFVFASSSTVYGEPRVFPTPEDYSPLQPISIYGATKLASESMISGYGATYGLDATILRLANIVGRRCERGVIRDFVSGLKSDPARLRILGDGSQRKSYLHVDDCVSAFLLASRKAKGVSVINVGSEDQAGVVEIADAVAEEMGLHPRYEFTGGVDGGRGWKGDVKEMVLDVGKLKGLGWKPSSGSIGAVRKTLKETLKP